MERVREAKFTMLMCIALLWIAAATSIVLYHKEVASIELLNSNAYISNGASPVEALNLKQEALISFLVFAAPVVPVAALFGKRRIQSAIVLSCGAVLLLALSAPPGGDMKGCEECMASLYLSLFTSAIGFALLIGLLCWVLLARLTSFNRP